ncbi:MAG TPA: hypothetical protein VD866_08415 [Urbifossiella sp.]|nr:hypothetical protein [Urbifossiella sp.]
MTVADSHPDPTPADVLDALLAPSGNAVVALVGPAGSGKSLLLHRLEALLGPTHHVVRLSGAADRAALVAGFEIPPPPPRDEAAVAAELLDQFRAALQRRAADARAACEEAAGRGERPPADERAVAETHGDGLVALLDGPTKDALFRDTPRRKSPFRALVRHAAAGEGEPAEFAAADFEFPDVNSARLADPKAQRYVAKLKTNLQGERAAAAALMNAARDAALLALPAAAEPPDPFAAVREELARTGRDLVVLHDDYVPGLLDDIAATDGPGRCPVRVALATADDAELPTATVFTLGKTVVEVPEPEQVPEPERVPEVVVAEPRREVDAVLGALAVRLGRLPVPAPDDVVHFLVAAHTTGATLDLLTPGVLEWLWAHGLTTGFRVRAP